MPRVRVPFSWEDKVNPLQEAECSTRSSAPVALPAGFGEDAPDYRDAIAQMEKRYRDHGLNPEDGRKRGLLCAKRHEHRNS